MLLGMVTESEASTTPGYGQIVSSNIYDEMRRQGKRKVELEQVIGKSTMTVYRRLKGEQEFTFAEIEIIADWLGKRSDSLTRIPRSN